MKKVFYLCLLLHLQLFGQQKNIEYFVGEGLKTNPSLLENTNLQQSFELQKQIIAAQNKKPLISFTADYLFAPFFFDNGKPISITGNPSSKAFGYDAGITNGGLYAAQFNIAIPLFNTSIINNLYSQNKAQADVSVYTRKQTVYDVTKSIIDQYIISYTFQQQGFYLKKIIDQLESRKPLVAALVKQGLLQQNDFLLLDIQILTNKNDLKQQEFAFNNGLALLKNLSLISDSANYILEKPSIQINQNPSEFYYVQKFKLDSLNIVAQQNVFENKYKTQVSIMGSTGINATEIANIPHNIGLSAGIHVGVPIRDGNQRKLYRKQNQILINNQKIYRDNTALLLKNNLRNAKQQIVQWQQTISMAIEPIEKQELLLDIIKDKVIKGQVTVMDYINALQEYALLQKNKAIAETNLLLYINLYNYYNR